MSNDEMTSYTLVHNLNVN